MTKVLILVLSALRDPWGAMLRTQQATWDAVEHPQTFTVYYCGKADPRPDIPNVVYSPTNDESLEQISARTIENFEASLTCDWDYMARCHSSMYVHKRNLVDFIETLPAENTLCGLLTTGLEPFLWGGGGFIMSRDVIERFVANKQHWNPNQVMEDNAITDLARFLDIPLNAKGRMASINEVQNGDTFIMSYGIGENFTFTDWADITKAGPHYYYRVKQDLRRERDLDIMRQLERHLPK